MCYDNLDGTLTIVLLEKPLQGCLVVNDVLQVSQALSIRGVIEPKMQITASTIFIMQMCHHTTIVLLGAELRIVFNAKLNGSAYDGVRIDETVSLCHDTAIDGAGLVARRGTMILGSVSYDAYLLFREPLAQVLVVADNPGRHLVMMLAAFAQPRIVVSTGGINHIRIDTQLLGQLHALPNHHQHMVALMSLVEAVIPRYDVLLHIFPKSWINNSIKKIHSVFLSLLTNFLQKYN